MDSQHFDNLARLIGTGASRRQVLKLLAGGMAGGLLALFGREPADARERQKACRDNDDCPSGATCENRRCQCGAGQTLCQPGFDFQCVDITTDFDNCGDCRNQCPFCHDTNGSTLGGAVGCVGGQCTIVNDFGISGLTFCGDDCVDLDSSRRHCGACGNRCGPRETCDDGACQECPDGQRTCQDAPGCHDFATDPLHCGGCFQECPRGATCTDGTCLCPQGQEVCTDLALREECVDLQTESRHCGGCGDQCPEDATCQGGTCVCPEGQSLCGDIFTFFACIDTSTDSQNCGDCGHHCDSCGIGVAAGCSDGVCTVFESPPGSDFAFCGDDCVDLDTNPNHCGACDNSCDAGVDCINGECGCGEGERSCGEECCPDAQLCCDHVCCAKGVTTCDGPGGSCGCGEGERRCGDDCCPDVQVCCDDICCAPDVAFCDSTNGGCCPPERTCNGVCCASGESCINGVCDDGSCTHPFGMLTVRGETCCPTGFGGRMRCGRFGCAYILSGTGPGGCDVWCDGSVEGGLCSQDASPGCPVPGSATQKCCCTVQGTGACIQGCA